MPSYPNDHDISLPWEQLGDRSDELKRVMVQVPMSTHAKIRWLYHGRVIRSASELFRDLVIAEVDRLVEQRLEELARTEAAPR